MIPWKGGIAVVLGDVEILALVCGLGEGGCELQMSGFEFMNMADNGSTLNVCTFRTALTIGLDVETIISFL